MSHLTEVESNMSIRKVPMQNIYTCRFMTYCDWCNEIINRGDQVNIFAPNEFTGFLRDLLTRITARATIPIGVSILISKFIFKPPQQYYISDRSSLVWPASPWIRRVDLPAKDDVLHPDEYYPRNYYPASHVIFTKESICLDCCGKQQYVTRSGRISIKPYNKIINTIPGSGSSGCDQYDRSFDGDIKDGEHVPLPSGDLKGFIVSDKELTSQHAIMDTFDEDEESEFSDYETSDEDEPCWVQSDDED